MLCIGDGFAVICLDSIIDEEERKQVMNSLEKSWHNIIDITLDQMSKHFAWNMLALRNNDWEQLLVMSEEAHGCLSKSQIELISESAKIVSAPIPTIEEIWWWSARCMILENFLQKS